MCGIAGLQLKNPDLYPRLGELVVPMLDVLTSRGPDSTGVAVYRRDAPPGEQKYSLCAPTPDYDWAGYVSALEAAAGVVPVEFRARGRDGVIVTSIGQDRGPGTAGRHRSVGTALRLRRGHRGLQGRRPCGSRCARATELRHGRLPGDRPHPDGDRVGGDRRALASLRRRERPCPGPQRVVLELRQHPQRRLAADGVRFDTDNDSEVAARFIARRDGRGRLT